MIFKQITTFSMILKENANNISLEILNKKLDEINMPPSKPISFADIVKSDQNIITNKSRKPEEKTMIISANKDSSITDLQQKVHNHIRNMRSNNNKTKINKIIKSRTGIIIKTPTSNDIDSLIEEFKKQDEIKNNANIYQAKALDPTIVLKKVDKITDSDNINIILCNMNPELEGLEDEIKLLFPIKTSAPHQDLVLRVSPKVYCIIKKLHHVHTDLEVVQIRDRVMVRQCQNCFIFHPQHKQKECPNLKACKTCGVTGPHQCDLIQRCHNCIKHPMYKSKNIQHQPNNKQCPIYQDQINRIVEKTCYNPVETETTTTTQQNNAVLNDIHDQ
ncbi:uncharacterized protein LOC113796022 [Dermatophagoides pteronyssinus]|uniref:Uncharacterized protein LOC113796022 n=1 Tax=Dermatophagoides pteronyssinus TaxID=6956 RepID=A0A6P6YBR4_DERPT|nr:uncharacterized protein LOC113796022 [Dermatophagoides pteronyssinus]